MAGKFNEQELVRIRYDTYAKFRAMDLTEVEDPSTDEIVDNFRQILITMVGVEIYPELRSNIIDQEYRQMLATYFYLPIQKKIREKDERHIQLYLPEDFLIRTKFFEGNDYTPLYSLYGVLLQEEVLFFDFMIPYFWLMCEDKYTLEKRDIPILERIAYSIMTRKWSQGIKRVDVLMDFIGVLKEFQYAIRHSFKNTDAKSSYVIDKTMQLFKEIAILWSIAVLQRVKTGTDPLDEAVSVLLTNKLAKYRKVANTI